MPRFFETHAGRVFFAKAERALLQIDKAGEERGAMMDDICASIIAAGLISADRRMPAKLVAEKAREIAFQIRGTGR